MSFTDKLKHLAAIAHGAAELVLDHGAEAMQIFHAIGSVLEQLDPAAAPTVAAVTAKVDIVAPVVTSVAVEVAGAGPE